MEDVQLLVADAGEEEGEWGGFERKEEDEREVGEGEKACAVGVCDELGLDGEAGEEEGEVSEDEGDWSGGLWVS